MASEVDTEAAVAAFFDFLSAAVSGTFVTRKRRLKVWSEVVDQPALFVRHIRDEDSWSADAAPIVNVDLEVWLYVKIGEDDEAPDTTVTAAVKTVRDAIEPEVWRSNQTLSELVYRCRIEGHTEIDPGDQDNQGKAVIPVRMMLRA